MIRESKLQAAHDAVLEIDAWLPAGWRDPWRHMHPAQEERVCVGKGQVEAEISGWSRTFSCGETFIIPPGSAHSLTVAHGEAAHLVIQMTLPLRCVQPMQAAQRLALAERVQQSRYARAVAATVISREFANEFALVAPPAYLPLGFAGRWVAAVRSARDRMGVRPRHGDNKFAARIQMRIYEA